MDPFSLAAGLVLGAMVGLLALSRRRGNQFRDQLSEAEHGLWLKKRDGARLEGRLRKLTLDREYYASRLESAHGDLARVTGERDEYRRIATTHEPEQPGEPPKALAVAVWRGRQYANHPSENLEILARDLDPHLHRMVELRLELEP